MKEGGKEYPTVWAEENASIFHAIIWFMEIILFTFIFATHMRIAVARGGFTKLTLGVID